MTPTELAVLLAIARQHHQLCAALDARLNALCDAVDGGELTREQARQQLAALRTIAEESITIATESVRQWLATGK